MQLNKEKLLKLINFPLISIVVPNFNGLHFLKKSIPSLIKTNYPNLEIIIIDNGSTDKSVSFLKTNYPSIIIIKFKHNMGISFAFNVGLKVSSGRYISFLNNDMEFDPNWLLPLFLTLRNNDKIAGCDSKYLNYYDRKRIDQSGGAGRFMDRFGNAFNRGGGEYDKGQYETSQKVFHGLSLFKKDLIMQAGGFDDKFFAYYDETDLCWRLHRMGYDIQYVPESRVYHVGGGTTKKFKAFFTFHYYKNKLRMLIKNNFGFALLFSILIYFFDLLVTIIGYILTKNPLTILIALKAVFWNIKNIKDTLAHRKQLSSMNPDLSHLFLPYYGIVRSLAMKLRDNI